MFFNIFQILNPYQVYDLLIFPPFYRSFLALWIVPFGVFCLSVEFSVFLVVLGLFCGSMWRLASQEVPEWHLQGSVALGSAFALWPVKVSSLPVRSLP